MRVAIFCLFLFILITPSLQAQTADEVIQRYTKAIGGKKRWGAIKTLTTSGLYDYGGLQFPFTSYAKAPDHYAFKVTSNGKYYAQGFDGKSGWKIDVFKDETTPTLLEGDAAKAMANEADVDLTGNLLNYKAKGHQAQLEGKDSVGHALCHKVVLTLKSGAKETFYFDATSFLLIQKTAVSKNVELGGALLNTRFSDYRDVNGIKVPFRSESETGGQTILTVVVDRVVIDAPVEDAAFRP